jgi:poly(A) polymerase
LNPAASAPGSKPRILPRSEHSISRDAIDKNALKVLYRLHQGGYKAYLVGGSVRDLMMGRKPKDFDIGTSARPNEIRRLFRNARIIGRRFRLAHILFAEGVVEVSTFRRAPAAGETEATVPGVPADRLITSDNVFGTPAEDAARRDFTVNALFYDIADFSVIDWVGGIDDLQDRLIRSIGDPDLRFQEDPVRMVRACEFAARLGFTIEAETQAAIGRQRAEIRRASAARLAEELIALMRCGHAGKALQWMLDLGLLEIMLPETYAIVAASEKGIGDFASIVPTIDRLIEQGRVLSDGLLLASLLVPGILLRRDDLETAAGKPLSRHRLLALVEETIEPFVARFSLSQARATQLRQTILTFNRMCEPHSSAESRAQLAARPSFGDALVLFEILAEATGEGHEALRAWQAVGRRRPPAAPAATPAAARRPGRPRRRRGRPR